MLADGAASEATTGTKGVDYIVGHNQSGYTDNVIVMIITEDL